MLLNIVVLNINLIDKNITTKFISTLKGFGINNLVNMLQIDTIKTYKVFCFLLESIFNNAVNKSIETNASKNIEGIPINVVNSSF